MRYKETEDLAKKIDFHFRNRTKWKCPINQPCTLTIKTRQGQYRKKSFIGGEELIGSSCYMGKKQGVIVVFTPAMPTSDYAYIEVPLKECIGVLDQFTMNLDILLDDIGDDSLLTDDGRKNKVLAKARETELVTNDVWGTW